MVSAIAIYEQVSSSDQCFPGAIQGMLTMNARTISGERLRLNIMFRARFLLCTESRLESAAAVGMKRAAAASIDVKRNADCFRRNFGVCKYGSTPHLVCARFSKKLLICQYRVTRFSGSNHILCEQIMSLSISHQPHLNRIRLRLNIQTRTKRTEERLQIMMFRRPGSGR